MQRERVNFLSGGRRNRQGKNHTGLQSALQVTVGPIITRPLTEQDEILQASCYRSCLELAEEHSVKSVAFCCISTGEFRFPNRRAAEIALRTVMSCQAECNSKIKVIFNVFKKLDQNIYEDLLQKYTAEYRLYGKEFT